MNGRIKLSNSTCGGAKRYFSSFGNRSFPLLIFIFGIFWGIVQPGFSGFLYGQAEGYTYIRNYSYKEYDHQPQNWGIAQAQNGIIYVANNGGVLEYDGVSWRIIGYPEYLPVRSLDIAQDGVIYIGGINKVGYLKPDKNGSLKFESLVSYIDKNNQSFEEIWKTHATHDGVYFRATNYLFWWEPQKKKMFTITGIFKSSFVHDHVLYVKADNKPLMQVINGVLKAVPGCESLADQKIDAFIPYDIKTSPHTMLIKTRPSGFYIYDGRTATPFPTEADQLFKETKISHALRLSSGNFAFATPKDGLFIMDSHGHLETVLTQSSGLEDINIKYIIQDKQDNLWLCLDQGLSKIEYSSPLALFNKSANLEGIVLSITKHKNDLYVGTANGLFLMESSHQFVPVKDIPGSCWSLVSIGDSLLVATSSGVFQYTATSIRQITKERSFYLLPSQVYPGRIWCGTTDGLAILSTQAGQCKEEQHFYNVKHSINSIAESPQGNIWLGTKDGIVFHLTFLNDTKNPDIQKYDKTSNLPEGDIYVTMAAKHVIFATPKGLFQFSEKKKTFIPDLTLGETFKGGANPVFLLVEDQNKHIWFHSQSRNFHAVPQTESTYTIYNKDFLRLATAQVNAIYPDPNNDFIWFASYDGLVRYDKRVQKKWNTPFTALIRRIIVSGKLIFDGCIKDIATAKRSRTFHYNERKNFHIEVAAPFFENESATQYRYILEGNDIEWSPWTTKNKFDFNSLDSGFYTFRVQAKNIYNEVSQEATYSFRILPPWYLSWIAFIVYFLVLVGMIVLIVKWRSSQLLKEKTRLELLVREQTKEVIEKNELLEKQAQKLQEMDHIKSRFFANISHEFRSPLFLIMGPAEQMLSNCTDEKQRIQLDIIQRNSKRLLEQINRLLNLSRFDSGQMMLKAVYRDMVPFLKGIFNSYQLMAVQKKLHMEFKSQQEHIWVHFDVEKMEEAIHNLLVNAIKFTPEGGIITITVSETQGENNKNSQGFVQIEVIDTGIGISPDQLSRIFDRFFQVENNHIKSYEGTGIGLSLVKEIIGLHEGKIDVHSQEGKGTHFIILLPMSESGTKPITYPLLQTEEPTEASQVLVTSPDEEGDVFDENKEEKNVILVIDDEADARTFIRSTLEPQFTVIEAKDGLTGIQMAKELIPDLIVSDIMMPEVDGYQVCETLKKEMATSHIPIILLTAKASDESVIKGMDCHADDYITKPFKSKLLLSRIKNLIDLRRQLQKALQIQNLKVPTEIKVSSMDDIFLAKFRELIEQNLADPDFRVDTLCEKLEIGRSTLFKKIKALTGEQPNQFILTYRLERGRQLLEQKAGNITEIAMAVGFNSPSYFAKCFKEKFGKAPSARTISSLQ